MRILPCVRLARAAKFADFWNWPPKNIPDLQNHVAFQKLQKSAKLLHPNAQAVNQSCFCFI